MFFYKLDPRAKAPVKKDSQDAGYDFFGLTDTVIHPGEIVTVSTGIVLGLDAHTFAWDRSGLGSKGVKTFGGVIDKPYVGEVKIVLGNLNLWPILQLLCDASCLRYQLEALIEKHTITIQEDKAIAQLIIDSTEMIELSEEKFRREFSHRYGDDVRGTRGFGSSDANTKFLYRGQDPRNVEPCPMPIPPDRRQ